MLGRRSLHVKHIHFRGSPHVTKVGGRTRRALQQDGHRVWGVVLYRSTYKSDADWAEFLRRLLFRTQRFIEISHPPDLVNQFRLTVLEDESAFDGATTSAIRAHFKQWTETAVEDEQGASAHPKEAQRYRYCVQVDEKALDSVVRKAPVTQDTYAINTVGYVRLIRKDWKPDDVVMCMDGVVKASLEDFAEAPIEGCTRYDVGWMKVPYDNLINVFRHLRPPQSWDDYYHRPRGLPDSSTVLPIPRRQ
ncbi:hypothetical protein BJY00DRAFT_57786 [Aspergillus carlsbadensis]|nr:hypothetical protein BJY00DRAFT_57786 [Aspergillus carlsbadensis]